MFLSKVKNSFGKSIVVTSLAITLAVSGFFGVSQAKAAYEIDSATWSAYKSPGYDNTPSGTCKLTQYGGSLRFYTYQLSGSDSMTATCRGTDCTINNTNQYVRRTQASSSSYSTFRVKNFQSEDGTMSFKITVTYSGGKDANIYASGKICHD